MAHKNVDASSERTQKGLYAGDERTMGRNRLRAS